MGGSNNGRSLTVTVPPRDGPPKGDVDALHDNCQREVLSKEAKVL